MWKTLPSLAVSVAVGLVVAAGALLMIGSIATARPMAARDAAASAATLALERSLDALSAQSNPSEAAVRKAIDYVRDQLRATNIRSGRDFHTAARIAERGGTPEDALLAHDLACCALAMGEQDARVVVATALDQYLTRTGRPQRYGTQAGGVGSGGPVTDGMRFIMGVEGRAGASSPNPGPVRVGRTPPQAEPRLNVFVAGGS